MSDILLKAGDKVEKVKELFKEPLIDDGKASEAEECKSVSSVLNKIVKDNGYDYLYTNPMEVYSLLPKRNDKEAKLSNAVIYALLSGVGNKNRNKLSVVRGEVEALSLDCEMTNLLDALFSSLWEENYLKDAKAREYGGYEEFCFRIWDMEIAGGAVWTSCKGKKKVLANYKYSIKYKVENSSTVFSEVGENHYITAGDLNEKYRKLLESVINEDFKSWCEESSKRPHAENYDIKRGEIVLDFFFDDHGLQPLTISFEGSSSDIE